MTQSRIRRWLYRGQRPNLLGKILNRADALLTSIGVTARFHQVSLEVVGRKSGRVISLPLVMVTVDGQRYLVSMLGEDVQWVHNVRAAGGRAVIRSGSREEVRLSEVPPNQRAPILKVYLQHAPGARAHVPVDKDASLAEFEKVAGQLPTFRVTSID